MRVYTDADVAAPPLRDGSPVALTANGVAKTALIDSLTTAAFTWARPAVRRIIPSETPMTPKKNVAIAPDLLERAGKVAQAEGKTVDELATEALQRDLARRTLDRFRSQGELRRRGMSDEQVESTVEKAVHEARGR